MTTALEIMDTIETLIKQAGGELKSRQVLATAETLADEVARLHRRLMALEESVRAEQALREAEATVRKLLPIEQDLADEREPT